MRASELRKVVTFNDLFDIFKKNHRIDLYDVNRSGSHFDKWCKAKGVDRSDNGQFKVYQQAEDGHNASPAYFNFWHFCNDWRSKNRKNLMPITERTIPAIRKFTEQEKASFYNRLEAHAKLSGHKGDFPSEFYQSISDMIRTTEAKSEGAAKIIRMILKDFGGPIVLDLK